jgi:hypothetical protein
VIASHGNKLIQYPALLGAGRGEIAPTDYAGQFGTRRKSHLGPHRQLQSDEGGMVAGAIAGNISRQATQPSGNLLVEAMRGFPTSRCNSPMRTEWSALAFELRFLVPPDSQSQP